MNISIQELFEVAQKTGIARIPSSLLGESIPSEKCQTGNSGCIMLSQVGLFQKEKRHCLCQLFLTPEPNSWASYGDTDNAITDWGPYLVLSSTFPNTITLDDLSSAALKPHDLHMRPCPLKKRYELNGSVDPYHRSPMNPTPVKKEPVVESSSSPVGKEKDSASPPAVAPLGSLETNTPSTTEKASSPTSAPGAKTQRDLSIFDLMTASAKRKKTENNNDRGASETKKKTAVKPGKKQTSCAVKKKDAGKSVMKLAKASGAVVATSTRSFLDDHDDGLQEEEEEEEQQAEARLYQDESQDVPPLDVQETKENDDLILCDDAPPFIFSSSEADGNNTSPSHPCSAATATTSLRDTNCMRMFLNPSVTQFQQSYGKEVKTEMSEVNGEYVCREVIVYRSKASGELLSQEEFHRKSTEMAAAAMPTEQQESPSCSAAVSPARVGKSSSRPVAAKRVAPRPPAKDLTYFFGRK